VSTGNNQRDSGGESVIQIRRCACVVKGGRRFSFAALVVTGERNGRAGYGYGKAKEVPLAVEKATKVSNRSMKPYSIVGGTIPHQVMGEYRASRILLLPAKPGTGIIAGECVRNVLEAVGITDILSKSYGSTNPLNLVKATFDALSQLQTRDQVERLRGVSLS
jgi:small subunit ribosomal protein S5